MVPKLTREWWIQHKENYVFDRHWFDAFKDIDPRFSLPSQGSNGSHPELGKMGVVFWHEPDGKTIIPVGITYWDGKAFMFRYHPDYVKDPDTPSIAHNLPKANVTYHHADGKSVLPFFDNLISEGWLGMAQRNAIHREEGKTDILSDAGDFETHDNAEDRYKRLLLFGRGFHGAVAVVDAAVSDDIIAKEEDEVARSLRSLSSVGGAQPKMLVVQDQTGHFYPAERNNTSTHIAKLMTSKYVGIVQNEYLNIIATKVLLPDDETVEAQIAHLQTPSNKNDTLCIKRFDRTPANGRIHFEEALQLMDLPSFMKDALSYRDLARLTRELMGDRGVEQLFKRLVAQFMMGNTDGHLKNFAFWKKNGTWEMTPNYDLVTTEHLAEIAQRKYLRRAGIMAGKRTLPLLIGNNRVSFGDLDAKRILMLGEEFGLEPERVQQIAKELRERVPLVIETIMNDSFSLVSKEKKQIFCKKLEGHTARQLGSMDKYAPKYHSRFNGNGKDNGNKRPYCYRSDQEEGLGR